MAHRQALRRLLWSTVRSPLRSPGALTTPKNSLLNHQRVLSCRPMVACTASFHTTAATRNNFVINIQDKDDFNKQVLSNDTPVVVDFHAGWCGPCKILGPRLESLIASKEGKVILAKIDVDDHGEIAMDHQVEAVPTVLAVKNGKVHDKFVGVKDDSDLENFVNKLIGE